ncbi:MAG: tetratricopeptide repeat protein [Pyrinomonadaceae bacterium]
MRMNKRPAFYLLPFIVTALTANTGCSAARLFAFQGAKPPAPQQAVTGSYPDAKALSDSAYEALKQNNYASALVLSAAAIERDPTLAEAHKNMAIALCDQGRCEEALGPAREAVRLKPDLDKARYVLGKTLLGVGRYQEALAEYREALRINPEYDKAYFGLGLDYDYLNDAAHAAEAFRHAAAIKPEEWAYRFRLELAVRHVAHAAQPAPPLPLPAADFKADNQAHFSYEGQVRDYLYYNEFDVLERATASARASKARVADGTWELAIIYSGLEAPEEEESAPEAAWQYHIERLKRWADARPDSVTARVALAQAYVSYAWHARGNGYANTVSERGGQLFHERLALAHRPLEEARGLEERCPHWYASMLRLGLSEGWDRGTYERVFNEATAFEPGYTSFYSTKAMYLLPRWYGQPGEWTRFAEASADGVGGRVGSALYYLIVRNLADTLKVELRPGNFLNGEGVSWPRLKQGMADADRLYGMSPVENNRACFVASSLGDRNLTREYLKRIGDKWEQRVWHDAQTFEATKSWATGR